MFANSLTPSNTPALFAVPCIVSPYYISRSLAAAFFDTTFQLSTLSSAVVAQLNKIQGFQDITLPLNSVTPAVFLHQLFMYRIKTLVSFRTF
ncbi:MAG: hypothetical protein Phog2KO_49680 [Phototrophicaceae bacterium]